MFSFLDAYIFGWLISCNLTCVWEISSFKMHLFDFLHKVRGRDRIYTEEDWQYSMIERYGLLGEMLMCPLCYGTWLSLLISCVYCEFNGYPLWVTIICTLSWPTLNFVVLGLLKRLD